jgi:membrane fusion protein (multidrug efflux system)
VLDGVAQPYAARVIALEPRINESTRTLSLRALCINPDNRVTPGAFARVEMTIQENDQALMVPSEALVPDINGYKIFTVKGAVAAACPVETGIRNEQNVEITKGLAAGDTVVVSGVLMLRSGMSVQIAETR